MFVSFDLEDQNSFLLISAFIAVITLFKSLKSIGFPSLYNFRTSLCPALKPSPTKTSAFDSLSITPTELRAL